MKLIINHGRPERRTRLEKHLKERGITDVIFNDMYPPSDPFVQWLHTTHCTHMSLESISGIAKGLHTLMTLDEEFVMCADDDVVFPKDWKERVEKIHLLPINIVCLGVNYHIHPESGYTFTGNVGGMECIIVHRDMATFIANNVDFSQAPDIVISAIMVQHGIPLAITPICQQTSLIENASSTGEPARYPKTWVEYIQTYRPSGLTFSSLLRDFQKS
jgi:hypothetical protein